MRLHLVRHGTAEPRLEGRDHPDRALVPKGHLQLERLGVWYRSRGFRPDRVATSPYRRARESAEIFLASAGLAGSTPFEILDALVPDAPVDEALAALLIRRTETILAFGHEPLLSALAARLTGADASRLDLRKGGLIELDIESGSSPPVATLCGWLRPGHLR